MSKRMSFLAFGLALSLCAALAPGAPAFAYYVTLCNDSAHRVTSLTASPAFPDMGAASNPKSGLDSGQCKTLSAVPAGPYQLNVAAGRDCAYPLVVKDNMTWSYTDAMAEDCRRGYGNSLDKN